MTTIHIQLDDATYERLRQKAAAAGLTPDEYLTRRAREEAGPVAGNGNPVLGALAEDAEMVDAAMADVMRSREQPWRMP